MSAYIKSKLPEIGIALLLAGVGWYMYTQATAQNQILAGLEARVDSLLTASNQGATADMSQAEAIARLGSQLSSVATTSEHSLAATSTQGEAIARLEARVDSIIVALPALRTRVAWESVFGELSGAIVFHTARDQSGGIAASLGLIEVSSDSANWEWKAYDLPKDALISEGMLFAIAGKAAEVDPASLSFSVLRDMAATMDVQQALPIWLNPDLSVALYSRQALEGENRANFEDLIQELGFTPSASDNSFLVEPGTLANWPALIAAMRNWDDTLRSPN